ncbi:MAG: transporter substrate-binding domain-containing protein [Candidatus Marinimicrobia bacterium]|nr:transporter substrate-binding domain-containing protein [Candidatus Neomarinimicrobiota bacterium]
MRFRFSDYVSRSRTFIFILFAALTYANTIAGEEIIRVSGHYNYPPYEFLDPSGGPTGFNVEIFNEVAKLTGLEVQLELGPWEEVYTALETGEIDVLIGMYFSASRAEKFDFTIPYETVSYSLFIRGNSSIRRLDDLSGKDIVLVEGGVSINYITEQHFSSTIHQVSSSIDALRLLAAGNYDCTLIPKVQGQYNIQRYGFNNIEAVGPMLLPRNLSFAVVKGKPELLTKLNEGLRLLKASGQLERIHKKWIDIYEQNRLVKRQIIRFSIWIAIAFIILLLFSIGWVSTLRKRVKEKTLGLRQEISERKQVEDALQQANHLQEVIYKIANAASGSGNLDQLFSLIRQTLHDVIDTSNFYIALIDKVKRELYFPYFVDEKDEEPYPIPVTSGLPDIYSGPIDLRYSAKVKSLD